jgi:hypothetical protein
VLVAFTVARSQHAALEPWTRLVSASGVRWDGAARETVDTTPGRREWSLQIGRADARIRTADPFITSEVLYQLSYVGAACQSTRTG